MSRCCSSLLLSLGIASSTSAVTRLLRRVFQSALVVVALTNSSAALSTLIGVTGDGAGSNGEKLFVLDQTNASATLVMALGHGGDGETIAYNPVDGLLYHSSGRLAGDRYWESIDVLSQTIVSSGQFVGPDVSENENVAMVYNAANGRFLVANLIDDFFDITLGGAATQIGVVPTIMKGLAFAGGSLYGAANVESRLYTLNPANGSQMSFVAVTLNGSPVAGMNGLATHPETGELWGIFRVAGGFPGDPGTRYLGTVNPTTGVVTSVGILPYSFAGIAFIPEPSTASLLSGGMIAFALWRRRKARSPDRRNRLGEEQRQDQAR